MRAELGKIKAQYKNLNAERAYDESRTPSTDNTVLATKFEELVGEGLKRCKEVGHTYLQTKVNAKGAPGPRGTVNTTKKETVILPKFSYDEKTAYLNCPVWKK